MKKYISLYDSDGDGTIHFIWNKEYPGIDIEMEDLFGNVVCATFYKRDLVKKLKKLLKKLEQE